MSTQGYPSPPLMLADEKEHRRQIAERVAGAMQGKINAVASITLNVSATTTTITDSRIGAGTFLGFMPLTASAATAKPSLWVSSRKNGQATLTHASNAAADQTFSVLVIG